MKEFQENKLQCQNLEKELDDLKNQIAAKKDIKTANSGINTEPLRDLLPRDEVAANFLSIESIVN